MHQITSLVLKNFTDITAEKKIADVT